MLHIIDKYDSFTYHLVQYFGELGAQMKIVRNDAISVEKVKELRADRICISPSHQAIGQIYGGEVVRGTQPMHGKTSPILHESKGVFTDLPSPFDATRYHSLIVNRDSLPDCLEITAWTADNVIMGLRHKEHPVHGVQFHPESILTLEGKRILENFLQM